MKKVKKNTNIQKAKNYKGRKKTSFLNYKVKSVLTYVAAFCVISVGCLFFSSMILFKIKEIVVQGDDACEEQVLLETSGIKKEDNLFFTNTEVASAKLEEKIPEVDTVYMTKKFPNKLIIDVKKARKVFCIESEGQYINVSSKNKVLEISDYRDKDLILLEGITLESFEFGKKAVYEDKSAEKKILEFVEEMNLNNLPKITEVDFNNGFSFFANYDNRVKINFGFYENMDYKIRTASEIINNKLGAAECGTLDLSEVSKENRSYFTPNY